MSKINIALKQERDQILNKSLYLTLDIRISEFMDVSFKLQLWIESTQQFGDAVE